MLSRPLRLPFVRTQSWCWRANSTTSNSEYHKKFQGTINSAHRRSTDSIFIKSWDYIQSLTDAYTIIRAVERKYGKIREFKFWKDNERPEMFQNTIWAVFRSPESLNLVSEDADIMHIPVRTVDHTMPGGIGLNELQGLLESSDKSQEVVRPEWQGLMRLLLDDGGGDEKTSMTAPNRVLDVRVERAMKNWVMQNKPRAFYKTLPHERAIGHAFLDWSGFHDLPPLSSSPYTSPQTNASSSPMSSNPVTKLAFTLSPEIDHRRMRMVLTKWSGFLDRSDPSIPVVPKAEPDPSSTQGASTSSKLDSAPSPSLIEDIPDTVENEEWDPIPDTISPLSGAVVVPEKQTSDYPTDHQSMSLHGSNTVTTFENAGEARDPNF